MTALSRSPLAAPAPTGSYALDLLTGPGRRLKRLLAKLAGTTHGYSEATLERLFGSHVHGPLRALATDQRVEQDLGGRWRLTASGRALARRVGGVR